MKTLALRSWFIYVLDTSTDDLVCEFNFVGTFYDLQHKYFELYDRYKDNDNIELKIIMK